MCDLHHRVGKAFANLNAKGYFARTDWQCCQPCGIEALPDENEDRFVFFSQFETERMKTRAIAFLHWNGDGGLICEALRSAGVAVQWNGGQQEAIRVASKN